MVAYLELRQFAARLPRLPLLSSLGCAVWVGRCGFGGGCSSTGKCRRTTSNRTVNVQFAARLPGLPLLSSLGCAVWFGRCGFGVGAVVQESVDEQPAIVL
jgi:hypothetical protein